MSFKCTLQADGGRPPMLSASGVLSGFGQQAQQQKPPRKTITKYYLSSRRAADQRKFCNHLARKTKTAEQIASNRGISNYRRWKELQLRERKLCLYMFSLVISKNISMYLIKLELKMAKNITINIIVMNIARVFIDSYRLLSLIIVCYRYLYCYRLLMVIDSR